MRWKATPFPKRRAKNWSDARQGESGHRKDSLSEERLARPEDAGTGSFPSGELPGKSRGKGFYPTGTREAGSVALPPGLRMGRIRRREENFPHSFLAQAWFFRRRPPETGPDFSAIFGGRPAHFLRMRLKNSLGEDGRAGKIPVSGGRQRNRMIGE